MQKMNAAGKIIIAGITGTTIMTLYSYYRSKKEHQDYLEPAVMNKLIDNSGNLTKIKDEDTHPAGWGLHYGAGICFMACYYLLWKKALDCPTPGKTIFMGGVSGVAGILVWHTLFSQHHNPPSTNLPCYYKHLLAAHMVFTFAGVGTYKLLNDNFPKK